MENLNRCFVVGCMFLAGFVLAMPLDAQSRATKPASSKSLTASKWIQNISTSPIDDSKVVTLALPAENTIQGWLKSAVPNLIIRCKEGETNLYVITGMAANPVAGAYQEYPVRLRLGNQQAIRQMWTEATNNQGLFAPNPIALARELAKVKSFLFEFTPFNSNPAMATFDVTGLKLEPIAAACNWAEYDQRRKIAEQQKRLGVFELSKDPIVIRGLRIPQPYGWTGKVTNGDPDHIDIFSPGRMEDLIQFYREALSIYKWRDVGDDCWASEASSGFKEETLCLNFRDANWVHMTLSAMKKEVVLAEPLEFSVEDYMLRRPGTSGTPIPRLKNTNGRYHQTQEAIRDLTDELGSDVITIGGILTSDFVPAFTAQLAENGWKRTEDASDCWTTTVKTNRFKERLCIDSSLPFLVVLKVTPTRPEGR